MRIVLSSGETVDTDKLPSTAQPHFHDEKAAFAYLEAKLWPRGPVCPHHDADGVICGGEGYALNGVMGKALYNKDGSVKREAQERRGLKKCRACRAQFTVRIGTIFEDSHAPLHLWLQAIALIAASKKGISSNQLHRTLGVQLKTAWFMSHRIRLAMASSGKLPPMGGAGKVVEVDETYHGKVGTCNNRGMKVSEFAQIIDAYPAPNRTHWYELWSLDQQDRFMLRLRGSAKLGVGQIIRLERRGARPGGIEALEFSRLPDRFVKRVVVKPRSFKPQIPKQLAGHKPSHTKVPEIPPGTTLHKVYEQDAVSEAIV